MQVTHLCPPQKGFITDSIFLVIYMKNIKEPNTDPCGTPEGIDFYSDFLPFITTACLRFCK